MLGTKEFYEAMKAFEVCAKNIIRVGSMGYTKEPKESWAKQIYYSDGTANEAFKVFLAGYSYGKTVNQ